MEEGNILEKEKLFLQRKKTEKEDTFVCGGEGKGKYLLAEEKKYREGKYH